MKHGDGKENKKLWAETNETNKAQNEKEAQKPAQNKSSLISQEIMDISLISKDIYNKILIKNDIVYKTSSFKLFKYLIECDDYKDERDRIGKKLKINKSTLKNTITQLKDGGLIRVDSGGYDDIIYLSKKFFEDLKFEMSGKKRREKIEVEYEDNETKINSLIKNHYSKEVIDVVRGYPETKALEIDLTELGNIDYELVDFITLDPDDCINFFNKAIKETDMPTDFQKVEIVARFKNIPSFFKINIRDIKAEQNSKLYEINSLVRKSTDVMPKLVIGMFECRRCGNVMSVEQHEDFIKEPFLCESCETRGPFKLLPNESVYINYQRLTVEECREDLSGVDKPKQINVILEDDLTEKKILPGDKVKIVAIPRITQRQGKNKKLKIFNIHLEANNIEKLESSFEEIEITKEDEEKILKLSKDPKLLDKMIDSIAPHIEGHRNIKEAITYQLFSSTQFDVGGVSRIRGVIHILVLGDPSTGKSEILVFVVKEIAPKGIFTTGTGSSGVGLTATAQKDEETGDWTLEAGALVLANKGIVAIDEFDHMRPEDIGYMHEAMEQGTVSVTKAGIVATFPAETSVLAACNPKYGRFDDYKTLSEQCDIPPPMLSRFDLVFLVHDDIEDVKKVTERIIKTVKDPTKIKPEIDIKLLKQYIAYARKNFNPSFPDEPLDSIKKYFIGIRGIDNTEGAMIGVSYRQLWATIRIAKASARLRLSNEVSLGDAKRAIKLMDGSLKNAGLDSETGNVDIDKIFGSVTAAQRDKIKIILDIVMELEKKYGTAAKDEIITLAKEEGIDEEITIELFVMLKKRAELYEPKPDRFKVV